MHRGHGGDAAADDQRVAAEDAEQPGLEGQRRDRRAERRLVGRQPRPSAPGIGDGADEMGRKAGAGRGQQEGEHAADADPHHDVAQQILGAQRASSRAAARRRSSARAPSARTSRDRPCRSARSSVGEPNRPWVTRQGSLPRKTSRSMLGEQGIEAKARRGQDHLLEGVERRHQARKQQRRPEQGDEAVALPAALHPIGDDRGRARRAAPPRGRFCQSSQSRPTKREHQPEARSRP